MFRASGRRLAKRVGPKSAHRPPHVILGVPSDITEAKLKEKYHALARTLHPDMPNGDAKKFKEVTAAYNIMKAQIAKGKYGDYDEADGSANADGEDPLARKMKEHMKDYHARKQRGGRAKTTQEMMWDDEMYEILLMLGSWFLAFAFIVDRTLSRHSKRYQSDLATGAAVAAGSATASSLASTMSSVGGGATSGSSLAIKSPSSDIQKYDKTQQLRLERQRANTQQRFEDLRELFLVYDTDYVTQRRFTLSKISTDRVDEDKIPQRCAIVRHINTAKGKRAYDEAAMEMVDQVNAMPWRYVDSGPTAAITLEGLKRMPKHSPAEHRLTFVEYQSDAESAPRCMAAIINDRYMPSTGKSQRAIVTGRDEFHPALAMRRYEDLKSGEIEESQLAMPGWVPVSEKRA